MILSEFSIHSSKEFLINSLSIQQSESKIVIKPTSRYCTPLPSFSTPKIVSVISRLPMVNTLMSQTIIQNASVFRLDIFNVSFESDAFAFMVFFDFIVFHVKSRTVPLNANGRQYLVTFENVTAIFRSGRSRKL